MAPYVTTPVIMFTLWQAHYCTAIRRKRRLEGRRDRSVCDRKHAVEEDVHIQLGGFGRTVRTEIELEVRGPVLSLDAIVDSPGGGAVRLAVKCHEELVVEVLRPGHVGPAEAGSGAHILLCTQQILNLRVTH
ncbi:hypothetical protein T492DRAFT_149466 [Pavlovales sp. CCMP2436]|nr:hypothetical protein T492DRAFT_149466 [Pavlovales sp. CCMP2436]